MRNGGGIEPRRGVCTFFPPPPPPPLSPLSLAPLARPFPPPLCSRARVAPNCADRAQFFARRIPARGTIGPSSFPPELPAGRREKKETERGRSRPGAIYEPPVLPRAGRCRAGDQNNNISIRRERSFGGNSMARSGWSVVEVEVLRPAAAVRRIATQCVHRRRSVAARYSPGKFVIRVCAYAWVCRVCMCARLCICAYSCDACMCTCARVYIVSVLTIRRDDELFRRALGSAVRARNPPIARFRSEERVAGWSPRHRHERTHGQRRLATRVGNGVASCV